MSAAPKKMKKKDLPWGMPAITKTITDHVDASILELPPKHKAAALKFRDRIGIKDLTKILHAMRRWYSGNTVFLARKIDAHHSELKEVMELTKLPTLYRGFKLPKNSPILDDLEVGDVFDLDMPRNGGYSSWTVSRDKANMFSGATKTQVGLVVKLVKDQPFRAILAPPSHTEDWFNALYRESMAGGFRHTEHEYVIYAPTVTMEVLALKKR